MKEKTGKKKAPYKRGCTSYCYMLFRKYMAGASFQREFYERSIYGSTEEQNTEKFYHD